jgi:hypothetical protein
VGFGELKIDLLKGFRKARNSLKNMRNSLKSKEEVGGEGRERER